MEVRLETVLNSIDDAILCIDDESRIYFVNEAAGRLCACVAANAIGQPISLYPRVVEVVEQLRLERANSTGQPERSIRRFQFSRSGEGDQVPMEATVSATIVDGRKLVTAVMRDLTFEQQIEKTLYEARKTLALGSLASGIAHDFNNVLAAVLSQIDLVMHSPEFPASLRGHLGHAQTSARRGADLVSKLQAFSGKNNPVFGPVNLVEAIEQIVFMLRRSLDPKIVVQSVKPSEELWLVTADSGRLLQVLLNLGVNAGEAMPKGGILSFAAENVRFQAEDAIGPRRSGEFVRLVVRDTGLGMTRDIANRIFETHFSARELGGGPGLGLAIASAVVTEHSGWMEVESEVGRGSVYSIFLPRSLEPAARRPIFSAPERGPLEGKELILVVDDEELVRMVTKAVLAYRGYRVIEAEDGEDAVARYSANAGSISLVLMDLHMPKLNGHEALLRIREINPRARAILLSGGLQEVDGGLGELDHVAFLQKPFENQELLRAVRQLLDSI